MVAKMVDMRQGHKGRWASGTLVWSASPLVGLLLKEEPTNGCKVRNLSSGVGVGSVALTPQRRGWLITYHGPLWAAIVASILCQGCGQGANPLTLAYVEIRGQMLAGGCVAVKAEVSSVSLVC